MIRLAALLLLAVPAGLPAPPATAGRAPASPPPAQAWSCQAERAQRCGLDGCAAVEEGLAAEQFFLDVEAKRLTACLYTDCFSGAARIVPDAERPWVVTAFGVVRSARPVGGTPPPGGGPFPLTVTVDRRTGRFSAIWALSADGLQVDFGTCRGAGGGG